MNSQVEEIKSKLNIVDVVGEYVRLNKSGTNWKALCPFHNEKSPSFMVSEDKQIWHCFGCSKGGDVFTFVMEIEGIDFKEALKNLAEKAGVDLKRGYIQKDSFDKNILTEILELTTKFYETQLWGGAGKVKILSYLSKRGLKEKSIKEFRLGYAPDGWRNLLTFLTKKGYKAEDITRTGLLVQKTVNSEQETVNTNKNAGHCLLSPDQCYDRFRDRIIFPIANTQGKIVGFSARVAPGGDESQAKYVNTPETALYHKSDILYGISLAKPQIKNKNEIVVVEGNLDVVMAHQDGARNTVAVSGTALTREQIKTIKRFTPNVKLFFDMDRAGQSAAWRSTKECLSEGVNVSIVSTSGAKDAAEFIKDHPGNFTKVISKAKPALDYFYEILKKAYNQDNSRDKTKIIGKMAEALAAAKNKVEKSFWAKRISSDLKIEENAIIDIINEENKSPREFSSAQYQAVPGSAVPSEPVEVETFSDRLSLIRNQIIGLMFSFPAVWKELAENAPRNIFEGDSLCEVALEKGSKVNYSFNELAYCLTSDQIKKANHLIVAARFKISSEGELADKDITDPLEVLDDLLAAYKKELRKRELKDIEGKISEAEKAGDLKKRDQLLKKFNNLLNGEEKEQKI